MAGEAVSRGRDDWQGDYLTIRTHRLAQIDQMLRFAQAGGCRMVRLVNHFGDSNDSGAPCGICDQCDPKAANVIRNREPSAEESKNMLKILDSLRQKDDRTVGQLFAEAFSGDRIKRREVEFLVDALFRAGLVDVSEHTFRSDNKQIPFRRVVLTPDGLNAGLEQTDSVLVSRGLAAPEKKRPQIRIIDGPLEKTKKKVEREPIRKPGKSKKKKSDVFIDAPEHLVEALRDWRNMESKRRRVPAFRIMRDVTLAQIAIERPSSEEEFLAIKGFGPAMWKKYGEKLLKVLIEAG